MKWQTSNKTPAKVLKWVFLLVKGCGQINRSPMRILLETVPVKEFSLARIPQRPSLTENRQIGEKEKNFFPFNQLYFLKSYKLGWWKLTLRYFLIPLIER